MMETGNLTWNSFNMFNNYFLNVCVFFLSIPIANNSLVQIIIILIWFHAIYNTEIYVGSDCLAMPFEWLEFVFKA